MTNGGPQIEYVPYFLCLKLLNRPTLLWETIFSSIEVFTAFPVLELLTCGLEGGGGGGGMGCWCGGFGGGGTGWVWGGAGCRTLWIFVGVVGCTLQYYLFSAGVLCPAYPLSCLPVPLSLPPPSLCLFWPASSISTKSLETSKWVLAISFAPSLFSRDGGRTVEREEERICRGSFSTG